MPNLGEKVLQESVEDRVNMGMMDYSQEVILQRAFPWIEDGLKPVQRKIVTMAYMGGYNTLQKSRALGGDTAKIHPHGDPYESIVYMVQEDRQEVPFLSGHGNFGSVAGRPFAADRYTELKQSEYGKLAVSDIKKGTVPMVKDYSGTRDIPLVLPVKFPVILNQYQSGIAVGYSSTTVPFNMKDVAKMVHEYITTGHISESYTPDFQTGGTIELDSDNRHELINGSGVATMSLYANIEMPEKGSFIVTSLPFGVKTDSVIDKLIAKAKSGVFPEIKNVQDLSDYNGLKIQITTLKNVKHVDFIKRLYAKTPLKSNITTNPNVIGTDGSRHVYNISQMLEAWLEVRKETYTKALEYDISKQEKHVHYLDGLKIILDDVDTFVDIVRHTPKGKLNTKLQETFDLTDSQIIDILKLPVLKLNKDYILEQITDIKEQKDVLKDLQNIKSDDTMKLSNIDKEITDIANKFGKPERQTKVLN
jgi:DNA gyrase subunit A